MRKRIVIAVVAVLAIGALAVWLSQPKEGTLEYHQREYLAAKSVWRKHTRLPNRWERFYARMIGRPVSLRMTMPPECKAALDKLKAHERSLLEMGFLRL